MNKIMILGFLVILEYSDDKQSENVPARRTPTLDDLFADAFNADQHAAGPQSPPGPSDGRHFNVNIFSQRSETT